VILYPLASFFKEFAPQSPFIAYLNSIFMAFPFINFGAIEIFNAGRLYFIKMALREFVYINNKFE